MELTRAPENIILAPFMSALIPLLHAKGEITLTDTRVTLTPNPDISHPPADPRPARLVVSSSKRLTTPPGSELVRRTECLRRNGDPLDPPTPPSRRA